MLSTERRVCPPAGFPTAPVAIAQQLIRFNTANPLGAEGDCVRWIRSLLEAAGFETTVVAADPVRPILVSRLPGRGVEPALLLHAHVDVVSVEGQSWSQPPFGGEVIDGELWGRGAVDMKGQLAMMLAAILRLRASGESPAGDVVLAVVPDEENGSAAGSRFLVERHPELLHGVEHAVGEDGGAELRLGRYARLHPVVVAEKRTCWVRATLRGPAGHASRVASESGAVHKLHRLLAAIDDGGLGFQFTPVVDRMLEELVTALPSDVGRRIAAFRAEPVDATPLAPLDGATTRYLRSLVQHTVSATVLHGGTGTNVHPSEISVELDCRVLPGEFDTDSVLGQLRASVGCEMELDLFVEGEVMPPPRLDGFYDRLARILRRTDPGGVPLPMVTTASTDARLFSQLGIRCYGWLPLLHSPDVVYRDLLHCPDERIAVSALDFGAECFYDLLRGGS